jgi:hypothetical protein
MLVDGLDFTRLTSTLEVVYTEQPAHIDLADWRKQEDARLPTSQLLNVY